MLLNPIPLSSTPAPHPRNPYVAERSRTSADPKLWLNQLRRTNTLQECEAIKRNAEAEQYAAQWILQEAA